MKHGHKKGHKKHHRGGSYRIHNPDYKILAMAGAAGIVAAIGAAYLQANVTFFKTYWYALPLAFIAGGFGLLYLKMPTLGIALAGVGGLLGYTAYQAQRTPAAGFTDAGRVGMRSDSGLYERQAGAIMGDARAQMRASQQAGAIMGAARRGHRAGQRAAGVFTDAGGLNDTAGLNAA